MRRLLLAAAALSMAVPAHAEMSVATFLAKRDALKAQGIRALGSPDIKLLRGEMEGVTTAYRADLVRAKAGGGKPHSCPPPKGQAKMSSDDLVAHFRTIPAAEAQRTSIKTAFYGMMKKRYPCPA